MRVLNLRMPPKKTKKCKGCGCEFTAHINQLFHTRECRSRYHKLHGIAEYAYLKRIMK